MAHLGDEESPHNRAPGFADLNTSLRLAHPSSRLLRPLQRAPQRDFWYHAPGLAFPIAKVFFRSNETRRLSAPPFLPTKTQALYAALRLALLIATLILTPSLKAYYLRPP